MQLADGTLAQHCGNDACASLVEADVPRPVDAINTRLRDLLRRDGEATLWDVLSGPNIFEAQPMRLDRWLEITNSRRVVFGHKPHMSTIPHSSNEGRAINFDGGFSRSHRKFRRSSPMGATVAPLAR
jgi:hypothetical protein